MLSSITTVFLSHTEVQTKTCLSCSHKDGHELVPNSARSLKCLTMCVSLSLIDLLILLNLTLELSHSFNSILISELVRSISASSIILLEICVLMQPWCMVQRLRDRGAKNGWCGVFSEDSGVIEVFSG